MIESISGLIGAIIGGCAVFLGTYITNKKTIQLELKKIRLSLLIEKKLVLEKFINNAEYEINVEINEDNLYSISPEFSRINKFIETKSYYFIDSDEFNSLRESITNFDYDSEYALYSMPKSNVEFHNFIKKDLEITFQKISKLADINV